MKKVLVVDDQINIRRVIRLALGADFQVLEAADADQAYACVVKERPAAVVLDVMMPGAMNGFQLCERIKQDPELASIHVVMVTACGQVSDQEYGRALGADAYIVKPFSPIALARHMKEALAGAA